MAEEAVTAAIDGTPIEAPIEVIEIPAVTTAAEWKRKARASYRLRLPSGAVVLARRPDWLHQSIKRLVGPDEILKMQGLEGAASAEAAIEIADKILHVIIVDPVISPDPTDEGSLNIADVIGIDKLALFAWSSGAASPMGIVELSIE